jgi:uncharacterized sulfatase
MRRGFYLWISLIACLVLASIVTGFQKKSKANLPNVLLAISDDQSYPHASAYGSRAVHTPGFDRIAREGILFNNAFSAAPGCSPSRASLLTGRHIWELEDAGSHASYFPSRFLAYTSIMDSKGYLVGYTGKGWGPGNWQDSGWTTNPAGRAYNELTDPMVPEYIRNTDYFENFKLFLEDRKRNQPFCFWYGASEPHRRYKKGIGEDSGMHIDQVDVPGFLPDVASVRLDILDYMYEIKHFDTHLNKMIEYLEEIGELDNTLIIVTSDNGMPFPRAKANLYEYGFHMPLAIRWGDVVSAGRVVDDLISLTDIAPTLLEVLETRGNMEIKIPDKMTGRSFLDILLSDKSGLLEPDRDAVYGGRERHSCSRWKNLSYPIRALRTHDFLYIKNFKPERWPAGAPVRYNSSNELVSGFHDIDDFKESFIFENRNVDSIKYYFDLAVAKRPMEELYDMRNDSYCLNNLSDLPEYQDIMMQLRERLKTRLKETEDPRVTGNGDVWETYRRFNIMRTFPEPDWDSGNWKIENK